MINFKKINNNLDTLKIKKIDNFKTLSISTCVLETEKPFNILVKTGDIVKINQPILINEDNQKILCDISGKVISVKLKEETKKNLTYYVEIENDFKYSKLDIKIEPIKTKEDLIIAIKEFGIVSKNLLIYKELENLKNILFLDCYDEAFVFNNHVILSNFFKEIKEVIKYLKSTLHIDKIVVFSSSQNKHFFNNLLEKSDKIYTKKCKKYALNMFDLYKIYLLLKGEILNYEILSLTGKALKENSVLFVKRGAIFQEIIENVGGFIQNIEEIENFKYTAMLAYNDEFLLKEKIKKNTNEIDKQKLIKMLEEKQKEAKINIFDKLKNYHKKYLHCLSACFISVKNKKISTKNINLELKNNFLGLHFLNYEQFKQK